MKKLLIIAALCLLALPVLAQRVTDLPQASLPLSGTELLSLDQNGVSKSVPSSALFAGQTVVGVASGGTGLTGVGTAGTCLQSTGTGLTYGICGSGGGGVTTQTIITTGASGTAHLNGFLGFNSSTNTAKTANIPAPTGTLNIIIIADLKGDASSHAITAVPASGTIIGDSPSSVINTNFGTITLIDTTIGWVSI